MNETTPVKIQQPHHKHTNTAATLEEEEKGEHIEILNKQQKKRNDFIIEKYLFLIGFLFPIAWFIGSSSYYGNLRTLSSSAFIWKKRCRIAATLCLTSGIVVCAIVMVVNPKLFGLKTAEYYASAQTSSSSNTAIRPGVPLIGTNDWGDTVAGLSINDQPAIT
ncbi:hypothetical protein BDF20DRAFT_834419 [Mycotypha africana]|uniref:uncharacterized protein n=1 Tax=Mycotypha africana TaxID=64632 RepID=UPI0023014A44|nr:uncharacterized protein BDF20DRAFT_834419 [Mycotypha africana]KAI8981731.1 hypothetical protein BDF20DRAFT_834419 [Mycotypha africana]